MCSAFTVSPRSGDWEAACLPTLQLLHHQRQVSRACPEWPWPRCKHIVYSGWPDSFLARLWGASEGWSANTQPSGNTEANSGPAFTRIYTCTLSRWMTFVTRAGKGTSRTQEEAFPDFLLLTSGWKTMCRLKKENSAPGIYSCYSTGHFPASDDSEHGWLQPTFLRVFTQQQFSLMSSDHGIYIKLCGPLSTAGWDAWKYVNCFSQGVLSLTSSIRWKHFTDRSIGLCNILKMYRHGWMDEPWRQHLD